MKLTAALIVQSCLLHRFEQNLGTALRLAEEAARQDADFIIFPEMNLTGYTTGSEIFSISKKIDATLLDPFIEIAARYQITLITGLAEKKGDDTVYATSLIFFPDGTWGFYRKVHTAPFEKQYYTPGNRIEIFSSHQTEFGVQLCYDAHYPELSRAMAIKGADIIFIPHASPRGSGQEKYESWLRHLTARAFDNGLFIAACNQTGDNGSGLFFPGVSVLIGPDGHVISHSTRNEEQIHLVTIDLDLIDQVRSHKMRYFLPNRRTDLFED